MSRYLTRRLRRLMDESEQALLDASEAHASPFSRISRHVLENNNVHALWESRHANLLIPVAEQRKTARQIIGLRLIATRQVHGRAFIDYIRDNEIRGTERENFFAHYYGAMDYQNAVLAAHRQYMLSVSSEVSTSHLIDVMYDPISHRLLKQYAECYRQYFELSSTAATSDDEFCARALAPLIDRARKQLVTMRQKLMSAGPDPRCCEIERQACLARSGRYPALNYLNA